MFFSVNSTNATDTEKILAYQLFQIAKQLTSGQFLLLKACYDLAKERTLEKLVEEKSTMVARKQVSRARLDATDVCTVRSRCAFVN